MSYEHCDKHDRDATNGCAALLALKSAALKLLEAVEDKDVPMSVFRGSLAQAAEIFLVAYGWSDSGT